MTSRMRQRRTGLGIRILLVAGLAAALLPAARVLAASDNNWTGATDEWWDTAPNWSLSHVPVAGENVNIITSGNVDRTIRYYNTTNPNDVLGKFTVDGTGGTTRATFNLGVSHNFKAASFVVGDAGKGTILQTSGNASTTGIVYLGNQAGSDGRYTISGGTLTTVSSIYLGYNGTGVFNQSGGIVTTGLNLRMAYSANSIGQYTLTGGTLNSGDQTSDIVYVGQGGTGTFIHQGGIHHVAGDMRIGDAATATGEYTIGRITPPWTVDPQLDCQNMIVGVAGEGTFTINGAAATVRGNLTIGQSNGSDGLFETYSTAGATTVSIGGNVSISPGGSGQMKLHGGSVAIAGTTTVGPNGLLLITNGGATLSGNLTVSGDGALARLTSGTLTSQGPGPYAVTVGNANHGLFEQFGGTHTILGDLVLAHNGLRIGQYTLNDSVEPSLLEARNAVIGRFGTGVFSHEAGYVALSGSLIVAQNAGSTGTYTMSEGTLTVGDSVWVGVQGAGTMFIDGDAAVDYDVTLGDAATGSGTLTLAGGSLAIGHSLLGGLGASEFIYNGGTLSVATRYIDVKNITVRGGAGAEWATTDNLNCFNLKVGANGQAGRLVHSANQLNVAQDVAINDNGAWVLKNSVNANVANNVTLWQGSAAVQGGSLNVGGNVSVQEATFDLTGGAMAVTGNVSIGVGDTAAFAIADDTKVTGIPAFACQNLSVGGDGYGDFSIAGGTATVRGSLNVGHLSGMDGTVTLSKPAWSTTTMTVQGNARIGTGGAGYLTVNDASTLTIQGNADVGGPGTGVFMIAGPATVAVRGNLTVNGSGMALLRMENGHLTSGLNTGQTVVIGKSSYGVTEQFGGTHTVQGDLVLGELAGGIGAYTLDDSEAPVTLEARHLYAGKGGNGTFWQYAGDTNLSGSLYVGQNATSTNGTVNLSGGTFDVAGNAWVGNQGTGQFNVTGTAAVTVGTDLNVASEVGSTGSLTLGGGSLTVGHWIADGSGTGIFTYGGGTLSIGGHYMHMGEVRVKGGTGTAWTNNNAIDCRTLTVGSAAYGHLIQTANALTVSQNANLFYGGLYELQGGSADITYDLLAAQGKALVASGNLVVRRDVILGQAVGWTGTVEQTGGALTIKRNLDVGTLGGSGNYTLTQGTLASGDSGTDAVFVGKNATSTGTFTQRGGRHDIPGSLYIGNQDTAVGTYVLTDDPAVPGVPELNTIYAYIGYGSEGHYTQTGGTANFMQNLYIGRLAGSFGEAVLNDGTLTVGGILHVGRAGLGTLTQRGGTLSVDGEFTVGYDATGVGSWVLQDDPGIAGEAYFESGNQNVGRAGQAAALHYGGTNYCMGTITLGYSTGSSGTYTITGGYAQADDGIVVGRAGHGELVISGGEVWTDGELRVASNGGTGKVRLETGGSLHVSQQFIGNAGSKFIYNGGTYADGSSTLLVETFDLADAAGKSATWTVGAGETVQTATTRVGAGGAATMTVDGGLLVATDLLAVASGGGGTLTVRSGGAVTAGDVTLGQDGLVKVLTTGAATINGDLTLNAGGTFRLSGGSLRLPDAAALVNAGGSFAFDAGRLTLAGPSDLDAGFLDTALGAAHTLGAGRTLVVEAAATLQAGLVLDGGRLAVAGLEGGDCLDFRRGTLEVVGGQFVFGATGPLGAFATLGAGQTVVSANGIAIDSGAAVTLAGGTLDSGSIYFDVFGQLVGSGTVRGSLYVMDMGEVRTGSGETLLFPNDVVCMNWGSIRLTGGTFETAGPLMNQAGAMISGRGTLIAEGGHENRGAMTFSGGTADVYGDVINTGAIISSGGATVTFFDDVTNDGEIRTSVGCDTVFLGGLDGGGTFPGAGTVYIEGDLRPGHSPGRSIFEGALVLGPAAAFLCELAGDDPAAYDRLIVGDRLGLSGLLDVRLLGGYAPHAGDTFDILDWSTLVGTFDEVRLPALGGGLAWDTSGLYTSGQLEVVPEPATLTLLALGGLVLAARRRR